MISFDRLEGATGVAVVDPVERRRYELRTPDPVNPTGTDTDELPFPVDAAAAVETSRLTVPLTNAFVRGADGEPVADVRPGTTIQLPASTYDVEVNAPIKVYLQASGPLGIDAERERVRFEFDDARRVVVGARSYHQRPAATITVPAEPAGLLAALPYLGSALKATSCERSYPTLRGHPPLLDVGEALAVPDELEAPATGVRLELPAEYRTLYVAAPLAYYLGADVRAAREPRLVTDHGFEYALDGPAGFETTVERTLKQVFFLDCLTRTEGLYRVDLHERTALEGDLDLSFETLYGRALGRQLEAYLSVPYDVVRPHLPTWALTAHLPTTAAYAEALPYVLDDLGVVRTTDARDVGSAGARMQTIEEFMRGPPGVLDGQDGGASRRGGDPVLPDGGEQAGDESLTRGDDEPRFVRPRTTGSLEEAWFGEGLPIDATKATLSALRNRHPRDPRDGPVEVAVVCNNDEMLAEGDVVERTYGSRESLPFDVTIHEELAVAELAELLASDLEFLHYVGHIDGDGFECADGSLDAATVDAVGVRSFLLNACQSYRQGLALVEAGSVGGVVTLEDVVNSGAVTVGRAIARLLDLGFPLRGALEIARSQSVVGGHYIVVGDGNVDIAQDENGMPILCDVARVGDGAYELSVTAYLPREGGMGSLAFPYVAGNDTHFLAPGRLQTFRVTAAELRTFFRRHRFPVRFEGELLWDAHSRAPWA